MKPTLLALLALFVLASCGADGDPMPPIETPSVGVSGDVQLGVTG
jgi:predicted small lipoprotein YifL